MKKITAIILTAVIAFSLAIVTTPSTVSATPFTPLSGDVYYFTDNPNYSTNVSYLLAGTNYTSSEIHTIYFDNNLDNFQSGHEEYSSMLNLYNTYNGSYQNITNSYFIFEFYYEFYGDLNHDGYADENDRVNMNNYFDMIAGILSNVKGNNNNNNNNNNYIMFISATDQCRFDDYLDFLDYVDFHVDTDIYYTFVSSIIVIQEVQNNYDPIHNISIVFGQGFIDYTYYGTNFMNSYYMKKYFEPYIMENFSYYSVSYYDDIFTDSYGGADDLAQIHILFEIADGEYYDPYNDVTQYYYNTNLYSGDWIFITGSYSSDFDTCYRLDMMFDFSDYNNLGADIYYYNFDNYSLNYLINASPYKARPARYHTPTVPYLMTEYLNNSDLETYYNNWSGECDITYKMLNVGPGGWMIGGIVKDCWQLIPIDPNNS